MKRILALLIIGVLLLGLSACGERSANTSDTSSGVLAMPQPKIKPDGFLYRDGTTDSAGSTEKIFSGLEKASDYYIDIGYGALMSTLGEAPRYTGETSKTVNICGKELNLSYEHTLMRRRDVKISEEDAYFLYYDVFKDESGITVTFNRTTGQVCAYKNTTDEKGPIPERDYVKYISPDNLTSAECEQLATEFINSVFSDEALAKYGEREYTKKTHDHKYTYSLHIKGYDTTEYITLTVSQWSRKVTNFSAHSYRKFEPYMDYLTDERLAAAQKKIMQKVKEMGGEPIESKDAYYITIDFYGNIYMAGNGKFSYNSQAEEESGTRVIFTLI